MGAETEVKIRILPAELDRVRRQIQALGFRRKHERAREENCLFDSAGGELAGQGCALRLRRYGDHVLLTYKGPKVADLHFKVREEIEVSVADFPAMQRILQLLGFSPAFRYAKFREKFEAADGTVELCVDETPVGCFVEIEGPRERIEALAREFGWTRADFVTRNYVDLYLEQGLGGELTP